MKDAVLPSQATSRPAGVRSIILAASGLAVTQGIAAVLAFATSSVLARALAPEAFGAYTYATANALLFSVLFDVRALQWTNAIDAARGLAPGEVGARTLRALPLFALLALMAGAAGALTGMLEQPWVVGALAIPAVLVAQLQGAFQGLQAFRAFNLQSVAKLALILVGAFGLWFAPDGWRLPLAFGVWAIANVGVALAAARALRRWTSAPTAPSAEASAVDTGVRRRAWLVNAASIGATRVELLVVAKALPSATLGLYGVVWVLCDLMTRAAGAFGTALFPWVVRQRDDRLRTHGSTVVLLTAVGVMGAAGLGLLLVGRPAIALVYGVRYADAWRLTLLHLPGLLCLAAVTILNNVVAARGYPPAQLAAALLGVAAKLVVLLAIAGRAGVAAAAVAYDVGNAAWLLALVALSPDARAVVASLPASLGALAARDRAQPQ